MDRLRIATFNLLNLALPERDYRPGQRHTRTGFQKKIDWCASMLRHLDADVVAVQEVFDLPALVCLAEETARIDGPTYATVAAPAADGRGPQNGFLIRSAADVDLIAGAPCDGAEAPPESLFRRPLVRAVLRLGGVEVAVIGLHLKSGMPLSAPRVVGGAVISGRAAAYRMRVTEAAALAKVIASARAGGQAIVLAGDFNDGPDSATLAALCSEAVDSMARLRSATPPPLCGTIAVKRGRKTAIDHILISADLIGHAATAVVGDAGLDLRAPWQKSRPKRRSDHAPIAVTLTRA